MTLTLRLRFPHRQYHATAWDAAANSGAVEWPPSPWRLCRAILATWYTRNPEIPAEVVTSLVGKLAGPPEYLLPDTRRGHTRHYLPKPEQRSGENFTELTLAAYVIVDPRDGLLITWPQLTLDESEREALDLLVTSLPYLGRAESVVEGMIIEDAAQDDTTFVAHWRPNPDGLQRLLSPSRNVSFDQLQVTPTVMRKGRRLVPEGARWVGYEERSIAPVTTAAAKSTDRGVHVIRWRLVTKAPFLARSGVLATDRLRWAAIRAAGVGQSSLLGLALDSRDPYLLTGHPAPVAPTSHDHAHWLWTSNEAGNVEDLILWVPGERGLSSELAGGLVASASVKSMGERRPHGGPGATEFPDRSWAPAGYVPGELHFLGAGGTELAQDLGALTATDAWTSATPYLVTRRGKKNQTLASLAAEDVSKELRYRWGDGAAQVLECTVIDAPNALDAAQFRTYRWKERMRDARRAVWLHVTLSEPVAGPLLLGGLSHFGFGRFRPSHE